MADNRCWTLDFDADHVAWLVCDVPGTTTNVLSRAVMGELAQQLEALAARKPDGLIIRSAKPNGFFAGADISEFASIKDAHEGYELARRGQRILDQLAALPCPTVAAVHGFVLGGGLELALACRHRIAADDAKLALGLPEVLLGIHPGCGGTIRSVALLGPRAALDLMLKGKALNGSRALQAGLIDRLVAPADLLRRAKALILEGAAPRRPKIIDRLFNIKILRPMIASRARTALATRVRRDHYPSPYAIVDLWERHGARGDGAYEAEARSLSELMCTPTARNLVRVFRLQERLKALGGKPTQVVKHLHVIGAGVMGGDIATLAALRGLSVTLQDRTEAQVQGALQRAREHIDKRLHDPKAAAETLARLRMDLSGSGLAAADVVIEAIVEDLAAKRQLYSEIEPQLKANAIFATNTSSLKIEVLRERLRDPARLVGMHFFNPVLQMQTVEIVAAADTRAETVQSALQFTRKLDKLPLPCKSAPGFVVNRLLMPYLNEAIFALGEGIPAGVIDAAAVDFGMPMGPLELADVVGLDVALHVGKVLADAFERSVPDILSKLVADKKLGRKSGAGFYRWRDGKAERTAPSEQELIAAPEDLVDRLILSMLNEAVALLREGVIEDADLLDAGAIFATGFAPFRGGPLQYARDRGIGTVTQRLKALSVAHGPRFLPDSGWDRLSV